MLWCHPRLPPLQTCTDGTSCKRRVCFFAHTDAQLRKPEEDSVLLSQQLQAELAAGVLLLHALLLSWGNGGWRAGQSHLTALLYLFFGSHNASSAACCIGDCCLCASLFISVAGGHQPLCCTVTGSRSAGSN